MIRVEYSRESQFDIDVERHSDAGSSCCALFAAVISAEVLATGTAECLEMIRLRSALLRIVRFWDASGPANGCIPADALRATAAQRNLALGEMWVERPMNREALQQALATQARPWVALVTAVPKSSEMYIQCTGDTFAILAMPDGLYAVDSHRHARSIPGPSGMVVACQPGAAGVAAVGFVEWLWGEGGLLDQLRCVKEFVDVSAFRGIGHEGPTDIIGREPRGRHDDDEHPAERPLVAMAPKSPPSGAGWPSCGHSNFVRSCDMCRWKKWHRMARRA